MHWLTLHTFLSLSWDEWGSIVVILGAVIAVISWAIKRMDIKLFRPIYDQLSEFNENQKRVNDRLTRGDKKMIAHDEKFIQHDEQLKDHERRITILETKGNHEKGAK